MIISRQLLFFAFVIALCSCTSNNKYSYAIKDFRKSLQPFLSNIVSNGIVTDYNEAERQLATDQELIQLGRSEHPVLRAGAFREMLRRRSFNHFDILMDHLDDTAIVAIDVGEWGLIYTTVSDDIIETAKWKSNDAKKKTIDEIITKHNYLRSAYTILPKIQPQEKYYCFIKDMATRERKSIGNFNQPVFRDVELALHGLAKFKKAEDRKIIRDLLKLNSWSMGAESFEILRDYPDSSYLEVFELYYKRDFYRKICVSNSIDNAGCFIEAVASYKNNRSAVILGSILNRKPFTNCSCDTNTLKEKLVYAIWDNPCDAYKELRKKVEPKVKEYEKNILRLPMPEAVEIYEDSSEEKIRW